MNTEAPVLSLATAEEGIRLGGIVYRGPITLEVNRFMHGDNLAIRLITHEDGYPDVLAAVTVNLPNELLAADHVFVKNWSEGEGMLDVMVAKGWMEATGRKVSSGYVQVPEARLTGDLLELVRRHA
jgi:predicted GNAT family acetyltransferase